MGLLGHRNKRRVDTSKYSGVDYIVLEQLDQIVVYCIEHRIVYHIEVD